jgi:outer membrane protein TolC
VKKISLIIFVLAGSIFAQINGLVFNNMPDGLRSKDNVEKTMAKEKSLMTEMKLSLNEAITLAMAQNKDVLIANEELKKADAQISEAYGNAMPNLSFQAQYLRNIKKPVLFIPGGTPFNPDPNPLKMELALDNNYTASLSLSQVLFSAKVNTAIQIAKEYNNYTEHNSQSTREDVVLSVKKAYYAVLLTQKVVDVTKEGLELARATYSNLDKLYKEGMASEFDLLRAQVQVSNTEPMVSQAENNLLLAKNALRSLLALDSSQPLTLTGDLMMDEIPASILDEESLLSLQRNSSLLGLHSYDKILDKNITIQRSDYYPTLAAFGSYEWQTQDNGFNFNQYNTAKSLIVGVQLTYTLFDGFMRKYRTEQAIIEKDKLALNIKKLEDGIKIQVDESRFRMNDAKKRVEAQAKSVEQAQKALSIAEVRFKNGLGTQLELIDARLALTQTQINRAQSIYDYLVARADWEKTSGFNKIQ